MNIDPQSVLWKIHCSSPAHKIYDMINSADGRKRFWAESAEEKNGSIIFVFPNSEVYKGRILDRVPNKIFCLNYFDAPASFKLSPCERGWTDLTLTHENVPEKHYFETKAGWISVLLSLKAAVDFGIDLRNHNKDKSWDNYFVDN